MVSKDGGTLFSTNIVCNYKPRGGRDVTRPHRRGLDQFQIQSQFGQQPPQPAILVTNNKDKCWGNGYVKRENVKKYDRTLNDEYH